SFRCRPTESGATTNVASLTLAAPQWLRLVRFGDTFTAYYSADGASWTTLGSATVTMSTRLRVGLAAASGLADKTARAEFQNVLIEPLSASYSEWQNWMFTRRGVTDPLLTGIAADGDHDARQ